MRVDMKKTISVLLVVLIAFAALSACSGTPKTHEIENPISQAETETPTPQPKMGNHMSQVERGSASWGEVYPDHFFYDSFADAAADIKELNIYDEELDSTYVIHVSLPPDYDENKSYPIFVMLDGLWRVLDLVALRPMMVDGEIEDIIIATIAFAYGPIEEIGKVRQKDFVQRYAPLLDFVTDNLMPYLGECYNIDYSRSALHGHSFAGLFTYYAVFRHDTYENEPFDYYVLSSPTLGAARLYYDWRQPDDWHEFYDPEAEYWDRQETLDKELYLVAGNADPDPAMLPDIDAFMERMNTRGVTTIEHRIYEGEHSDYVSAMLRDALLKFYGTGQ